MPTSVGDRMPRDASMAFRPPLHQAGTEVAPSRETGQNADDGTDGSPPYGKLARMSEPVPPRPADDAFAEWAILNNLQDDAPQALLLMGELRNLTRWDDETLCRRLGCRATDWVTLGGGTGKTQASLRNSLAVLELTRDAVRVLELTRDRRRVLVAVVDLCAGAGGEVDQRADRVRAAFDVQYAGYSAWQMLELGEIDRASAYGALALEYGPAHERAVASARLTEPVSALTGHISAERLELLEGQQAAAALGDSVRRRMLDHLYLCTTCQRFAAEVAPSLVDGAAHLRSVA